MYIFVHIYLYIDTFLKIYDYIKEQFESVILFYRVQYEMNLSYMDWYESRKNVQSQHWKRSEKRISAMRRAE